MTAPTSSIPADLDDRHDVADLDDQPRVDEPPKLDATGDSPDGAGATDGLHHLGDEPAVTGDGAHTTVHRLGRVSITGGFDLPGEFDLPPEQQVRLVGEVPWELRDPED